MFIGKYLDMDEINEFIEKNIQRVYTCWEHTDVYHDRIAHTINEGDYDSVDEIVEVGYFCNKCNTNLGEIGEYKLWTHIFNKHFFMDRCHRCTHYDDGFCSIFDVPAYFPAKWYHDETDISCPHKEVLE